jgi:hypothetical protein
MNDRSTVMKLLARALLDIRIASIEGNLKAVFAIADFIHVVPHKIESIEEFGDDYSDIIEYLTERAPVRDMEKWFRHAMKEIGADP